MFLTVLVVLCPQATSLSMDIDICSPLQPRHCCQWQELPPAQTSAADNRHPTQQAFAKQRLPLQSVNTEHDLMQRWVQGQHVQGQDQWLSMPRPRSRPRPVTIKYKVKAKIVLHRRQDRGQHSFSVIIIIHSNKVTEVVH